MSKELDTTGLQTRTWLALTQELQDKLNAYRYSNRFENESLAVRKLLDLALNIIANKTEHQALPSPR